MVKYMLKDEKGLDTIEGKVWDCSRNLKLKDRVTYEMSLEDFTLMRHLIDKFPDQLISTENCSIFQMNDSQMSYYLPSDYYANYKTWLDGIYHAADPPGYKRVPDDHI